MNEIDPLALEAFREASGHPTPDAKMILDELAHRGWKLVSTDVPRVNLEVTLQDLLSPAAIHAFNLADYRLRHNARYFAWDDNKRLAYRLEKTFAEAVKGKTGG